MGTQEFGYPKTLGFDYNSDATARIFNGVTTSTASANCRVLAIRLV